MLPGLMGGEPVGTCGQPCCLDSPSSPHSSDLRKQAQRSASCTQIGKSKDIKAQVALLRLAATCCKTRQQLAACKGTMRC